MGGHQAETPILWTPPRSHGGADERDRTSAVGDGDTDMGCEDFNAPHTQGEYGADSPRGKRLAELIDELGLVLLNEPASHTRIGQGACRDMSHDLSIWSDAGAITWSNTFEDLGSDHIVLCMTMGEDRGKMDGCQKARVVDSDKLREQKERDKQEGPIEDIGEWCRELLADVEKATKEIE
ncbi:hypothetical protein MRX96_042608 [Rhipicephalus microplus]